MKIERILDALTQKKRELSEVSRELTEFHLNNDYIPFDELCAKDKMYAKSISSIRREIDNLRSDLEAVCRAKYNK